MTLTTDAAATPSVASNAETKALGKLLFHRGADGVWRTALAREVRETAPRPTNIRIPGGEDHGKA